jgi:purine-binding chemotaxis protein CheW
MTAGEPEGTALLATAFYLAGRLFALDAASVEEVVRLRRTTPVPHAPPDVVGVMNLRGKIVSVIDLALKLAIPGSQRTEESRVYMLRDGGELVGLLVDRAAEVIELDREGLEAPPANLGAESRFLRGVARAGDRLVAVLDEGAVLGREQ